MNTTVSSQASVKKEKKKEFEVKIIKTFSYDRQAQDQKKKEQEEKEEKDRQEKQRVNQILQNHGVS